MFVCCKKDTKQYWDSTKLESTPLSLTAQIVVDQHNDCIVLQYCLDPTDLKLSQLYDQLLQADVMMR